MKKLKYINGNLLDLFQSKQFDVIAHGANCFNMMGAGIAGQIAVRFPEAVVADNTTTPGDLLKLGSLSLAVTDYGLIFNLYTQYQPGNNLDYTALRLSVRKMARMIRGKKMRVGLPKIGAGIAGGNWTKIEKIISYELRHENVTIVNFVSK